MMGRKWKEDYDVVVFVLSVLSSCFPGDSFTNEMIDEIVSYI